MGFLEATRTCLRNYVTFSGRAGRAEYWKFVLFVVLVLLVIIIVNSILFGPQTRVEMRVPVTEDGYGEAVAIYKKSYNAGMIGTVFLLAMLLPLLAVGWRRLHDTGRRGWFLIVAHLVVGLAFLAGSLRARWDEFESEMGFQFSKCSDSIDGLDEEASASCPSPIPWIYESVHCLGFKPVKALAALRSPCPSASRPRSGGISAIGAPAA